MARKQTSTKTNYSSVISGAENQPTASSTEKLYEIHIKGQLDNKWSDWLDGLEVRLLESDETMLFGPIVDQSALLGILNKLGRMNVTLISFSEIKK
jgi:hypothetical protein